MKHAVCARIVLVTTPKSSTGASHPGLEWDSHVKTILTRPGTLSCLSQRDEARIDIFSCHLTDFDVKRKNMPRGDFRAPKPIGTIGNVSASHLTLHKELVMNQRKRISVSASLLVLALTTATGCNAETAYFSIVEVSGPPRVYPNEFILGVTDPVTIAELRHEIAFGNAPKPFIVTGIAKKGRRPYNYAWNFHVVPATVRVANVQVEVCSATPEYVSDHVDQIGTDFLPGGQWCPWSARVVREVKVPAEDEAK